MLAVPYKLQKFVAAFAALCAALLGAAAAHASCAPVAALPVWRASTLPAEIPPGHVGIRFLGHSSFVIESPKGVRAVTDYNGYLRPETLPDIVTMNHAAGRLGCHCGGQANGENTCSREWRCAYSCRH